MVMPSGDFASKLQAYRTPNRRNSGSPVALMQGKAPGFVRPTVDGDGTMKDGGDGVARSIVATGCAAGSNVQSVAAAGTATFTASIIEAGFLECCVVEAEYPSYFGCTEAKVANDGLLNGEVAAGIFRPDSTANPVWGHYVTTTTVVSLTVANRHASTASMVGVAWKMA